jgi:hypothetical protein
MLQLHRSLRTSVGYNLFKLKISPGDAEQLEKLCRGQFHEVQVKWSLGDFAKF